MEYVLTTGNFSGDIPLHFNIENGKKTYDAIVSVNANSIYKITLYFGISYGLNDITVTTLYYPGFGVPYNTSMSYRRHLCNVIVSDGGEVSSTEEINIVGSSITNISLSDLTFIGKSTSVEELSVTPTIAIYPNPAADFVTITGLQGDETLHFYTISGQSLFSHKATGETENIPVSHLPAGIYFVKTSNGQTLKWVKK